VNETQKKCFSEKIKVMKFEEFSVRKVHKPENVNISKKKENRIFGTQM
jgi:hypothetical protein